ncbi:MAG: TonB-dependent receptor [Brevundimonas sp.]|uniref:TonB-dependent receptor plug domain-containing protein n=1 Tax=Brevundimonas sp. TaxID=1871086 RepID=UPI00121B4064|nr:TonB-dependent receptor [Brevundimonas sp.]RZJ17305.1 MAG: TonB-dependent receptor [Brevundimonas sp.]
MQKPIRRLMAGAALALLAPAAAFAQSSENPQSSPPHDDHEADQLDDIIVQATRSRRRVQDEPIRVEVLGQEEIEEKLLMRPGNISMVLAETGGLRVQVTSPSLGSANIRVQGMRGRYTQLLADGLPLYGGQASSLGLLQIPPSDLGQVEVIKGAASALYGGQALGGVINLVSRRPGAEPQAEVIANVTTRNGQDLSAYGSTPLSAEWSASLLATANRQGTHDLDGDGWIDTPGYDRWSLRPRLFWLGDDGSSLFATVGAMNEDRRGGTLAGRTAPDGLPFQQNQGTRRYDAGLVYERPVGDTGLLQLRASGVDIDHRHRFGDLLEKDQHHTWSAEASLSTEAFDASWLGGVVFQSDDYASVAFPTFDYTYQSPAVFAQVERDFGERLTLAASARYDDHSRYGGQFSPRLSLLYRPGPWTVRASWGEGFYAPTPFVEETEAAGLSRLEPLSDLKAETAQTASIDLGYASGPWETSLTLFGSDIDDAVGLITVAPDRVRLANIAGVTRTRGVEALTRWRSGPFVVTGSYLYVDATEPETTGAGRREVPLTSRHSAGIVAMWENHDRGRIGFEAYYTGEQSLEDDPWSARGESYWELGLLGEVVIRERYRVFLNLENLLNVRQTRDAPLVRPSRAADGRWTVDAWKPLEGFVVNTGVRIRFGG